MIQSCFNAKDNEIAVNRFAFLLTNQSCDAHI
jgi:hypothetical protein